MAKIKTSTKPAKSFKNTSKVKKNSSCEILFEEMSPTQELVDDSFIAKVIWECLKENDIEGVMEALRTGIDAQNKLQLSKKEQVARSTIYDSFKKGSNPTLKTLGKLIHACFAVDERDGLNIAASKRASRTNLSVHSMKNLRTVYTTASR